MTIPASPVPPPISSTRAPAGIFMALNCVSTFPCHVWWVRLFTYSSVTFFRLFQ
jgi:hypothetical protein